MPDARRTASTAGLLFLITFATAVAGLLLYGPVLHDPDYVLSEGADGQVALGALLELVLAGANIGTAVVLFPLLRRERESLALGYVAARVLESTVIVVGIVSLLAVVTLRQQGTGMDQGSLLVVAKALVALHDWTFLLGPNFVAGLGNGLMLGWLLRRSGLVPKGLTLLGLVGGPLVLLSGTGVLFGLHAQTSPSAGLLALPEMLWEASLGLWLLIKGFRPSPLLTAARQEQPASATA